MAKKNKGLNQGELINSAVSAGIKAIIQDHPRFKSQEASLLSHIDRERLLSKFNTLYTSLPTNWSDEKRQKYIFLGLSNYVATSLAFDPTGKEIVVQGGLEKMAAVRCHLILFIAFNSSHMNMII